DGEVMAIDLPEYPDDLDRLKKFARSVGSSPDEVPRVAAVHSLTPTLLLARPTACLPGAGQAATLEFELLDYAGRSLGRHVLDCDYDSSSDGMYITRGTLVVVKGGRAALEATLRQQASMIGLHMESKPGAWESTSQGSDTVTIHAYDLAAHFNAQ
ncbi:MAG: hypothetical protein OEX18_04325, partial [Candidatus Krumholzibacteria bacterium]|nr:hypothetical protein [Candidatus Krumholzibacteria bacterium]